MAFFNIGAPLKNLTPSSDESNEGERLSKYIDRFQKNQMSQTLQENSKTALLQASFDFVGNDNSQLSFSKGDIVQPITTLPSGWWFGHLVKDSSVSGWFPSNYFVQYQKPIQWDNEKELPQIIPSTPSTENLKSSSDAFIEPTNANQVSFDRSRHRLTFKFSSLKTGESSDCLMENITTLMS